MIEAFAAIAKTGLPVAVHNEDQELVERLTNDARTAGQTEPIMHCRTRPPLAETIADLEIFEIGLQTGAHVHIAHSSLARGFALAELFRGMGMQATGEACVQYLCMTEDDIVRLAGRGKCNPPFRTKTEVERMWAALQDDKIAYVSTDHAPWPLERKTLPDIFACGAGLVGMQSFAPLMFTLLDERGLPPTLLATYCAERAANCMGCGRARARCVSARMQICACWNAAASRSMRPTLSTGRSCAGRRTTAVRCARASPRRCSAAA